MNDLYPGQVQIGHSHLRIRSAVGSLAPERPDLESLRSKHREYGVSLTGALLCIAFGAFTARAVSPDNAPVAIATNLLLGSLVLCAWSASWILLGRAVRSRWQWSANAAIYLHVRITSRLAGGRLPFLPVPFR
ncbi:MAG: hypothetical protein OEV14_08445 [Gammaproteobacteria bacterium]|nr:hypothetical protein [Gammaproteobacteria bacterium]